MLVADIEPGKLDETKSNIICVYSVNAPYYAIYGTDTRVSVQFADDPALQKAQRTDFAALASLRGEINGLIDGWRSDPDERLKDKARRYDRSVADALVVALTRDVASAQVLLQNIRDDLMADRTSRARLLYLVFALGMALAIIFLMSMGAYIASPGTSPFWGNTDLLWMGAGGGAVGAFFSITLAVQTREFKPEEKYLDNAIAAVLRVIIGAIAGTLLVGLLCTKMFTLQIGGLKLGGCPVGPNGSCAPAMLPLLIAAFIGGFTERLVPDMLKKVGAPVDRVVVPATAPRAAGQAPQETIADTLTQRGSAQPPQPQATKSSDESGGQGEAKPETSQDGGAAKPPSDAQ